MQMRVGLGEWGEGWGRKTEGVEKTMGVGVGVGMEREVRGVGVRNG